MSYVIVVLELASDTPGVDAVFVGEDGSPFETWEEANEQRPRAARLTEADTDDLVQVARIGKIRNPL